MNSRALIAGGSGGWANRPLGQHNQGVRKHNTSASQSANAGTSSYFERVTAQGLNGPLKAALTSATLSAAGDCLAQACIGHVAKQEGRTAPNYDPARTARMFGYGLLWYGPCQFYWYNLLEHLMPIKNTVNFLSKVTANQLILAPTTLTTVFAYTLALTGKSDQIGEKIARDVWPSMVAGWKFWIPAASLNFYAVPIQHQVLYMSTCGVLWTAYLSYASSANVSNASAPALAVKAA